MHSLLTGLLSRNGIGNESWPLTNTDGGEEVYLVTLWLISASGYC